MGQYVEHIRNTAKINFTYDYPEFPLNVTRTENKWKITHIPHWHDTFEFVYQSKGNSFFSIYHKTIELKEGQALLVNVGELHSGSSKGDYHAENYRIDFDPHMLLYTATPDSSLKSLIIPLINKQYKLPSLISGTLSWEKEILSHLNSIISNYAKKPKGYEFLIRTSLYCVFSLLIMNNALKKTAKTNDFLETDKINLLNSAFDYIHTNYHKKLTDNFKAYHSIDGNSWSTLGSYSLSEMGETVYAGLAVCSGHQAETSVAVFDTVKIL